MYSVVIDTYLKFLLPITIDFYIEHLKHRLKITSNCHAISQGEKSDTNSIVDRVKGKT